MSNPKLTDALKTDIENYLQRTLDYLLKLAQHMRIKNPKNYDKEKMGELLEDALEQYCDENNIKLDIEKTVEDFLTKRGEK